MNGEVISILYSLALGANALLFIPQSIKIYREKSAKNVSLITFVGFFLILVVGILYGIQKHDVYINYMIYLN